MPPVSPTPPADDDPPDGAASPGGRGEHQGDVPARRRAAVLAGYQGDEAGARAALDDPDPRTRVLALGALARLGTLGPDDLARSASDAAPAVRRRAAELAAAHAAPAGLLTRLLDDDDETVVEMAAWASGERRPPEDGAVPALARVASGHPDALCREAAVAALGSIGDPSGLPAVLRALDDRATVRRRAILALAPFEGPEVEAAITRHTTDRDWQVRQAAEDLTTPDR